MRTAAPKPNTRPNTGTGVFAGVVADDGVFMGSAVSTGVGEVVWMVGTAVVGTALGVTVGVLVLPELLLPPEEPDDGMTGSGVAVTVVATDDATNCD
ncbi:MAG: hypothetical protein Q4Q04_01535, partial [Methanocorpusculum sp.]|nr:hypothetical protein [Methanocorpusculum sp.]